MRPAHQTKSRLDEDEKQRMDYYDAYVDVKTVDLDSMPEPPIGDHSTPEYNKVSKKPGQLGGRKHKTKSTKRKTKSTKRKTRSTKRKTRSTKRKTRSTKRKTKTKK